MAGSPKYKVYDNDGQYVAACKFAEDAAILVSIGYPDRGEVRLNHSKVLFVSSPESSDSYDAIAEQIVRREREVRQVQAAMTSTGTYEGTWLQTLTSTTKDRQKALKFSSAEEAARAQRTTVYRTQVVLIGRFYRLKLV